MLSASYRSSWIILPLVASSASCTLGLSSLTIHGYLPFIHTLGIYLHGWYRQDPKDVKIFGQFRKDFSTQLREKCPRLRDLILKGFEERDVDTWIEDSGILEVPNITSLKMPFKAEKVDKSTSDILLRHVTSLAPSLHTLDLSPGFFSSPLEEQGACPLFKIDLPFLRSLTLTFSYGVDTDLAMAFFERHPSLEYLSVALRYRDPHDLWFGSVLPQKFLPNLLHLRANWKNVRLLAPILNQLISLSIHNSVNAQIPYLFRSILPNGLPNLKSLNIGQMSSSNSQYKTAEGNNWYESEDGTFKTKRTPRTVFNDFMHSIVRAVPNLEELGFHGPKKRLVLSSLASIADDLSCFPHLKRLYYVGSYIGGHSRIRNRKNFISEARVLAEAALGLVSIINVVNWYPPHPIARIRRRESGEIASIEFEEFKGCVGMEIGYEDEAFPCAPSAISFSPFRPI